MASTHTTFTAASPGTAGMGPAINVRMMSSSPVISFLASTEVLNFEILVD
jgi:hypothetical protein